MLDILSSAWSSANFIPHGYCLSWRADLVALHLVSDGMMGLAYLSISLSILVFAHRRRDLEIARVLPTVGVVFGFCGLQHLSQIAILWLPYYGAQGLFKLAAAIPSVLVAVLLWRLMPTVLRMPSPAQLRALNRQLEAEITEHHETEAKLRAARDRAEFASRAKSDFLATMSHELRTPLNAVLGFSETLALEVFGTLNGKQREYALLINSSGAHLLQIINDILDISKIHAGRLQLEEGRVALRHVVETCITLVRGRADERRIVIDSVLPPGLPNVRGDELRLKQILLNLLSNAIKFTPEGGRVTVRCERGATDGVMLTVRDTGIGMSPEDVPKALEMFMQMDNSLTRKYEGTGIGLPLTKALTELHGGQLDIDTALGQGTTVTVFLPAERLLEPA